MTSNTNQTPVIRGFQFGSGGIGSVEKSVNLFRGDLNLPINLLSFTGRAGKSTLDYKFSLSYQSNVQYEAGKWNREVPTGICGLGWDPIIDKIEVDSGNSPSPATNEYSLVQGSSSTRLIRIHQDWTRFVLPNSLKSALSKSTVNITLQKSFHENGIAISTNATIIKMTAGWKIVDTENEHTFLIEKSGLEVMDGGNAYELESFEFWKINYYPEFERWEIIKENGVCTVYGGGVSQDSDDQSSMGNSVEWGILWTAQNAKKDSIKNWMGSSTVVSNQLPYANAWNKSKMIDQWDDAVLFEYNIDNSSGVVMDTVHQGVGSGGSYFYTKACHLTKITDVFGRSAQLHYAHKSYNPFNEFLSIGDKVQIHQNNSTQFLYGTGKNDPTGVFALDETQEWTLTKVGGGTPADTPLQYGDTINIRSNKYGYLSARNKDSAGQYPVNTIGKNAKPGAWEQWIVLNPHNLQLTGAVRASHQFLLKADRTWSDGGDRYLSISTDQNSDGFLAGTTVDIVADAGSWSFLTVDARAAREYDDPHKQLSSPAKGSDIPKNLMTPNAFQDKYETVYLDQIKVYSAQEELVFRIQLEYALKNVGDVLIGDTVKRYLTGITQYNRYEEALPGAIFEYNETPVGNGELSGALTSLTHPEGGKAMYDYGKQELDICSRSTKISLPSAVKNKANFQPLAWFGDDYAISAWYNDNTGQLIMNVMTWVGRWHSWQSDGYYTLRSSGTGTLTHDSIKVVAKRDYFALSFQELDINEVQLTSLFLFHKNVQQIGQWHVDEVTKSQDLAGSVTIEAGEKFVMANQYNNANTTIYDWTWNHSPKSWDANKNPFQFNNQVFLKAHQEYYLMIPIEFDNTNNSKVLISYLDELGDWHREIGQATLDQNVMVNENDDGTYELGWTVSDSMAAISVLLQRPASNNGFQLDYSVSIFQWNAQYEFLNLPAQSGINFFQLLGSEDGKALSMPYGYVAQIINNSLVGSGPHLLRFNGEQWLQNTNTKVISEIGGPVYQFAYNENYAIQSAKTSPLGPFNRSLLAYDPDTSVNKWDNVAMDQNVNQLISNTAAALATKAANGDYFSIGRNLYYRANSTDWQTPYGHPIFQIPDTVDTPSLVNEAPTFLAYFTISDGAPESNTNILILKNGKVKELQILDNQLFPAKITNAFVDDVSGANPGGPQSFLTYSSEYQDFAHAREFTIYRFAGDAIQGKIAHYPVQQFSVDDGFGQTSYTSYQFEKESAACDPSGKVVKYYRSSVLPGMQTDDLKPGADNGPYGKTVHTYLNGYNNNEGQTYYVDGKEVSGETNQNNLYFQLLDGFLSKTEIFSSQDATTPITDTSNIWGVFTKKATKVDGSTSRGLYSGFTRKVKVLKQLDGVQSQVIHQYLPNTGSKIIPSFSGLQLGVSTQNINTQGKTETLVSDTSYGYEQYEILLSKHILSAVVQTKRTIVDDKIVKVLGSSATTWKSWNVGASTPAKFAVCQTFKMAKGSVDEMGFSFPEDGSTPSGWLKSSEVSQYSSKGIVLEKADVRGKNYAALYDANQEFKLASFYNASIANEEADYYSFETYESGDDWKMKGSAKIISTDAHTGSNSLQISKGGSLQKRLTPATQHQKYVLTCWYKTAPGYQNKNRTSGWKVTIKGKNTVNAPFGSTGGEWRYLSLIIDLSKDSKATVTLTTANNSARPVLIDNLRFSPLDAGFTGSSYHQRTSKLTATLGSGAKTVQHYYDNFERSLSVTNGAEEATNLIVPYYSRQGGGDAFVRSSPNHTIEIEGQQGSYIASFNKGTEWQQYWKPSVVANWSQSDGALLHNSASSKGILQFQRTSKLENFALFFELQSQPGSALSLSDGVVVLLSAKTSKKATSLTWKPNNGWALSVNGVIQKPLNNLSEPPTRWLILTNGTNLFFFANGQLVLSSNLAKPLPGSISINIGKNKVGLRNLIVLGDPIVGLGYRDAVGRTRQEQLLSDDNCILVQTIIGAFGKAIARTKPAPARLGKNDTSPLLTYDPDLVEVADFVALGNLEGKGIMSGKIATYYTGDKGYPFSRTRFEASPLARVIEAGRPGADNAIINPTSFTSKKIPDTPTTKFLYGANTGSEFSGGPKLPAGEFHLSTTVSATQVHAQKLTDKIGRKVVGGTKLSKGSFQFSTNKIDYSGTSGKGHSYQANLPNFYDTKNHPKDHSKFIMTKEVNLLGQTVKSTAPDRDKPSLFVYNKAGQLRFALDASGQTAAQPYFAYFKFDDMGRKVEQGIVQAEWSEATEAHAEDASYPSKASAPTVSFSPQRINTFFEEGEATYGVGQVKTQLSYNQTVNGVVTVTERYTYNKYGRIASKTTQVGDSALYKVIYTYDDLGKVTSIAYPESKVTGLSAVQYRYNGLGKLVEISGDISGKEVTFVTYTYGANGKLISEAMNQQKMLTDFSYAPTGSLEKLASKKFSESLVYNVDGTLKSVNDDIGKTKDAFNNEYQYDNNQQVISAINNDAAYDISAVDYDGDGNIVSRSKSKYAYAKGTNKVTSIKDATGTTKFTHNPNGAVIGIKPPSGAPAPSLNLKYQKGGTLTTDIEMDAGNQAISFAYGGDGKRKLKQISENKKVTKSQYYISGPGGNPILEVVQRGSDAPIITPYIYGKRGLVGFQKGNDWYYVIKDHLGSNRLIVNEEQVLVADYSFLPFGGLASSEGVGEDLLYYRFTGQEYDDESGLYNYNARLYDQRSGRFLSIDPRMQFASPYVYAGNNPISRTDPTGMFSLGGAWHSFKSDASSAVHHAESIGSHALHGAERGASALAHGAEGLAKKGYNHIKHDADEFAHVAKEGWHATAHFVVEHKTLLSEIAAGVISVGELAAGGVLMGLGFEFTGNLLLSMGVAGTIDDITQIVADKGFSWKKFGEDEAIGLLGGAIGGVVSIGAEVAGDAVADSLDSVLDAGDSVFGDISDDGVKTAARKATQFLLKKGITKGAVTFAGGFANGLVGQEATYMFAHGGHLTTHLDYESALLNGATDTAFSSASPDFSDDEGFSWRRGGSSLPFVGGDYAADNLEGFMPWKKINSFF